MKWQRENNYLSFIVGLMFNLLIAMCFILAGLTQCISEYKYNFWSIWCIILGQISIYTFIRFIKDTTLKEAEV